MTLSSGAVRWEQISSLVVAECVPGVDPPRPVR